MGKINLDPGPKELPFPWYERNGKQYPLPSGEGANHPAFLSGWELAVSGENSVVDNERTSQQHREFWEGYQEGIYWAISNGIVDSFRGNEMFMQIPPAVPAKLLQPSPPENQSESLHLGNGKSVLMPPNKSESWKQGFRDAVLNRSKGPYSSVVHVGEYNNGYHSGIEWLVEDQQIPINKARELLGIPSYANIFERAKDEEDEDDKPEHVNHPNHYNFGKYEVVDVLNDWQLPYPLSDVVKYSARAGKKDPETERQDLEKARFYLNYRIVQLGGDDWNPKHKEKN